MRQGAFVVGLILVGACSAASGGLTTSSPVDAGAVDGENGNDSSHDAGANARNDADAAEARDAGMTTTTDSSVEEASITTIDAARQKGQTIAGANACGICDRVWMCDASTSAWLSQSDGTCMNEQNHTVLRCDGTIDRLSSTNIGSWTGNDDQMQLSFNALGSIEVVYCLPPLD